LGECISEANGCLGAG